MIRRIARLGRTFGLWMLCAWFAAGCAKSPAKPSYNLVNVEGTVTRNGKPVPRMIVMFVPAAEGGTRARGVTGPNGHYRLVHESMAPGVECGEYKVTFRSLVRDVRSVEAGRGGGAYTDPQTTPYAASVTIPAAKIDFELDSDDRD
ncbi:MAG: carboxypeptidase-like regulatory domain-containing protein [Planctomycetaceae bacterium]